MAQMTVTTRDTELESRKTGGLVPVLSGTPVEVIAVFGEIANVNVPLLEDSGKIPTDALAL